MCFIYALHKMSLCGRESRPGGTCPASATVTRGPLTSCQYFFQDDILTDAGTLLASEGGRTRGRVGGVPNRDDVISFNRCIGIGHNVSIKCCALDPNDGSSRAWWGGGRRWKPKISGEKIKTKIIRYDNIIHPASHRADEDVRNHPCSFGPRVKIVVVVVGGGGGSSGSGGVGGGRGSFTRSFK